MTEITAKKINNHYRIDAVNHAESKQVCAAISGLLYALEGCLFNHDTVYAHYSKLDFGDAYIEFLTEDPLPAEDFRCVLIGLLQVEASHPDEVRVTQNLII